MKVAVVLRHLQFEDLGMRKPLLTARDYPRPEGRCRTGLNSTASS